MGYDDDMTVNGVEYVRSDYAGRLYDEKEKYKGLVGFLLAELSSGVPATEILANEHVVEELERIRLSKMTMLEAFEELMKPLKKPAKRKSTKKVAKCEMK
jgi:hypothetical protein